MKRLIVALVLGAYSLSAQSTLIDRGGGFIYDDVLDVTWTQDANINGLDTWANQVAWADSLSRYDSVRDVTWNDWRLPSMSVGGGGDAELVNCSTASEVECRDNEYGYLHYQYAVSSNFPGLFTNVQSGFYWSATEFEPSSIIALIFKFGVGNEAGQGNAPKTRSFAESARTHLN